MLINCPECKKEISDQSARCPHCGYSVKKHIKAQEKVANAPRRRRILIICSILAVLILSFVLVDTLTDWIHPQKITGDEYNRIQVGMTYDEVVAIIGRGHKSYRMRNHDFLDGKEETYVYPGVGESGCEVTLYFVDGELDKKEHTGVPGALF